MWQSALPREHKKRVLEVKLHLSDERCLLKRFCFTTLYYIKREENQFCPRRRDQMIAEISMEIAARQIMINVQILTLFATNCMMQSFAKSCYSISLWERKAQYPLPKLSTLGPIVNHLTYELVILYFVDRASRYKFLVTTNLTHFFMYLFISRLYMFRASQRSSSGDRIVLIHHLV